MVKVKDLVDVGDVNYKQRAGELMLCVCGTEIGGTRGDLWQRDPGDILRCPVCGSDDLSLVRKVITYVKVKKE